MRSAEKEEMLENEELEEKEKVKEKEEEEKDNEGKKVFKATAKVMLPSRSAIALLHSSLRSLGENAEIKKVY